jgi:glycyl-tRNA synthetase beta chain
MAYEYEAMLRDPGNVIVRLAARKSDIERQLRDKTNELGATLGAAEDTAVLLDEVTALVEHPTVYVGRFDPAYLEVPQECLILTMRQNQKYFPLFDSTGKLQPRFLIVSNMKVADPRHIIGGNERVVRPRLEDARFFYNQDRKERLEARVPRLAKVVYHNKLGSQLDRVQRIQLLAGSIARRLKADSAFAERAAWLSKADLLTGMVGEFPELQGLMGRYYAMHDGESPTVADAIEAHYRPRFAGDSIPEHLVACSVALADKLDTIAGLFGIGEQPTGEKDPFGLRRAALGVIRIIVEHRLALSLHDLVNDAFAGFPRSIGQAHTDMQIFVLNRFESYLKDRGFSTLQVDAVLSKHPTQLNLVPQQLEAVKAFQALPEAESLAAANKRIVNILRQAEAKGESFSNAELKDLKEPAERTLFQALQEASAKADKLFERGDYTGYLKTFAVLKAPVDTFFDKVMVMVDHEALRRNRLALLQDLRGAMNRVADISKLAQ